MTRPDVTAPHTPATPDADTGELVRPWLAPPDRPGDLGRLGPFRVLYALGGGGMGVVLRAEDPALGRPVALKVMRPELAARPGAKGRFLREARAAAAVDHPRVVPVWQVGEADGVAFIAMPLLAGRTLAQRLKSGPPVTVAEAVRLARETADGLAAAHAVGVVHRDVKPANIWLDDGPDGAHARLLDFGLARVASADGSTSPGAVLGTPAYMPPEQADGRAVDARADLFGLGAVLYEVLTGRRAFPGDTWSAVLAAVAAHHPPPPHAVNPLVPRRLSELVMRLLDKDPAGRPAGAAAVAAELEQIAADPSPTRPDRGRRRMLVAGVVLAAVLLAVGGYWLTRPAGPGEAASTGPVVAVTPPAPAEPAVRYTGQIDVRVERDKRVYRMTEPGVLPLRPGDLFEVEVRVSPPSYLYVVWVDPGKDVTPVYPWDAKVGWGSRPTAETPTDRLRRPADPGVRYRAPKATPGVATMVVLARPTPLDVGDEVVRGWFEGLGELPLPPGGEGGVVWFDDYAPARDPDRPRTFAEEATADPFGRWQGALRRAVGDRFAFETAVSFARGGGK